MYMRSIAYYTAIIALAASQVKGYGSSGASNAVDDGIEWTKATSKNGVPFEFGVNKTRVTDHQKEFKGLSVLAKYEYPVNWPVGDDTWKATSGNLYLNWITQYKLHDNRPSIYDYRLDITAKIGRGTTYYFQDASGDIYSIYVALSGDHYVRYNSGRPTIFRVNVTTGF